MEIDRTTTKFGIGVGKGMANVVKEKIKKKD
jgi:hypothetical protein